MRSVSKARSPKRVPGDQGAAVSPRAQVFRSAGDYWTIVYAGSTLQVHDAIGLHYLARLLAHPHHRFAAEELLAAVKGNGGGDPERARSAVSKRIRAVIAKITQHHPALGFHLSTTVKTGYACAYSPDPTGPMVWAVDGIHEGKPAP